MTPDGRLIIQEEMKSTRKSKYIDKPKWILTLKNRHRNDLKLQPAA